MIRVRPCEPLDLEPLRAIMNQVVEQGDAFAYDAPFTAAQMRRYIESYSAAFVAEEDGQVMGGYVLRPNQPGRGAYVANATYMVAPGEQGRGLGRLLGEHSLQEARRQDYRAMQFNLVVSTNQAAVRLWERLGFRIVATLPGAFRHRTRGLVDALVMFRSLADD
jgi:L-amino acid N-acyltransferase YncA